MHHIKTKLKSLISNSFFCGRSIAVLLILLLAVKQWAIYTIYGGQITGGFWNTILLSLGFLGNDLMVLGLVLLFVFINLNIHQKIIKWILNSINIILILIFFIDILTILFFQSRLSLFEMFSFFSVSTSTYFFGYIFFALLFFVGLFILSFLVSQKFLKKLKTESYQRIIALGFFGITLIVSLLNIVSKNTTTLSNNILTLNIQTFKNGSSEELSLGSGRSYESYFSSIKGKNKQPNIILLFAESLSAVDSQRAGGIYNNLPLFDKIQSEGITFTNFIANGCTSETAHISVLQGVEPREYPRIDTNQNYDAYASYQTPLPLFMKEKGYQSTFLSTVSLDFLNQKQFLSGLGYSKIIGEEDFIKEKKYVFNAAPDHALYNKALQIASGYNQTKTPFFLTLQSISSHRPYDTPYGQNTKEMFSYVDKSLYAFYQKLKKSGFFEDGILVIVSDHRKMEAINKEEFQKYGLSSKSRVVATIVGKDIKKNSFNNNIVQHTDIYNSLKYLVGKNVTVSSLFNNAFSKQSNRDWGLRYCRFAEKIYVRINEDGSSRRITNKTQDNMINSYIKAYKSYQAEKLLGLKGVSNYQTPSVVQPLLTGFTLIAHGGGTYQGRIPNTVNTAMRAKKDGANALELDISFSKDSQNVVIHGPSLQTTACGPNKSVTGFTLKELKEDCPLRNGEKILTLEEFLSKTKNSFELFFVEIKVHDSSKAEQQTLDAINTIIKLGMEDKVVFISYDRIANYIIGSHKKIRAGWDSFYEESDLIHQFPHQFYLIPQDLLSKNTVEIAQAMSKTSVVYTLNDKENIKNAVSLGVTYLMTDNIPLVKSVIRQTIIQKK